MSKPIWEEVMDEVSTCGKRGYPPYPSTPDDTYDDMIKLTRDAFLRAMARQLLLDPPPEAETFSWVDIHGEPQVEIELVGPEGAFPGAPSDKKRRYWLIEIPDPEIRKHDGPVPGILDPDDEGMTTEELSEAMASAEENGIQLVNGRMPDEEVKRLVDKLQKTVDDTASAGRDVAEAATDSIQSQIVTLQRFGIGVRIVEDVVEWGRLEKHDEPDGEADAPELSEEDIQERIDAAGI